MASRHPATVHLDAATRNSTCPVGTELVAFQSGVCVGTIPVGAELFLVDPVSGKLQRRITGGDDLSAALAPVL